MQVLKEYRRGAGGSSKSRGIARLAWCGRGDIQPPPTANNDSNAK
jgi:hypothetical protein